MIDTIQLLTANQHSNSSTKPLTSSENSKASVFAALTTRSALENMTPEQLAEKIISGAYNISFHFTDTVDGRSIPANFRQQVQDDFEKLASHPDSKADLIEFITDNEGNIDKRIHLTIAVGKDSVFGGTAREGSLFIVLDRELYEDKNAFLVTNGAVTPRSSSSVLKHELEHAEYENDGINFKRKELEEESAIAEQNKFDQHITPEGEVFVPRIGYIAQKLVEGEVTRDLFSEEQLIERYEELKTQGSLNPGITSPTWNEYFLSPSSLFKDRSVVGVGDLVINDASRLQGIFKAEVTTQRAEPGESKWNLATDQVDGFFELREIINLVKEKKDSKELITDESFETFLNQYLEARNTFLEAITIDDEGVQIKPGIAGGELGL